jgi:hypothetical protein
MPWVDSVTTMNRSSRRLLHVIILLHLMDYVHATKSGTRPQSPPWCYSRPIPNNGFPFGSGSRLLVDQESRTSGGNRPNDGNNRGHGGNNGPRGRGRVSHSPGHGVLGAPPTGDSRPPCQIYHKYGNSAVNCNLRYAPPAPTDT